MHRYSPANHLRRVPCNASATPQAIDAVKRHHAADAVVSQIVEEAPPAELAHGIDDMSPTGALTTLLALITSMHIQTLCGSRHLLLNLP